MWSIAGRTKTKRFSAPKRAFSRRTGWATVGFLWLVVASSPARPDAAAGREAYQKGDYNRAMAEWQAGADRNDSEAEFGLGHLYEIGAGDLKQNYKQADYWYRKAADQGNGEAQYRLALVWAVGGDDFPADLAEAYKWVLLAVESKSVWGSPAADLKTQLDKVISGDQRAEAEKRVTAWKEARAPKKGEPAVASAPSSQPPTATALIEELNQALAQIDCASLDGRISATGSASISGTVPDSEQKAKLIRLAERLFPNTQPGVTVEIVPPPLCRSLAGFQSMRVAGLLSEGGLSLRLNNGSSQLRQGDPIKLEVRSPDYPVNLRIDYFSLDGQVAHLAPDSGRPAPKLAAGTTHLFGNPANGEVWNAGGAPFGTELITVIATPVPLDLGASRPKVELAADYLHDVQRALGRISVSSGQPNIVVTLLVKTRP